MCVCFDFVREIRIELVLGTDPLGAVIVWQLVFDRDLWPGERERRDAPSAVLPVYGDPPKSVKLWRSV